MARKIESLLRIMADMQKFEQEDFSAQLYDDNNKTNELLLSELDSINAATGQPLKWEDNDKK